MTTTTCLHCGKALPTKDTRAVMFGRSSTGYHLPWIRAGTRKTKYCSEKCGRDYKNPQRVQYRQACKTCGKDFVGYGSQFCSRKCANSRPALSKRRDHTGLRFHNLVAIRSEARRKKSGVAIMWWLCQCDCGNQKWMVASRIGKQKSCGCLAGQNLRQPRGENWPRHKVSRVCIICDEIFEGEKSKKNTCSPECHRIQTHNRKLRNARDYRNQALTNPQGERQWLIKSKHELTKIKRLLKEGSNPPPKA